MSGTFTPRLDILPKEQRDLWPQVKPVQQSGFVLYGGTAIALRQGHRKSVDFDFFTSRMMDKPSIRIDPVGPRMGVERPRETSGDG